MFKSRVTYKLVLKVLVAVAPMLMTISCWDEVHPGTYYTFTGKTVATYLEQDTVDSFKSFITVLKRAGVWGELETYGTFTCFAPTDEAFDNYLKDFLLNA